MKQYRTLNDGEIVMEGDEFWGIDRTWIPSTEIGKKVTSYTHKMYRRPMTETSSQMTDICPDCSDIPCDCGLPAGYQSDIRFACNFAPHIKVMEATKVAEIIQQRDELLRYNEAFRQEALICSDCDAISKEEYDRAIEQLTAAREELIAVTEQRDRLAGGLKWIAGWNHQLFDENTAMQMRDKAEQALQSLNPDHAVDANDMIAAVKGGSDES